MQGKIRNDSFNDLRFNFAVFEILAELLTAFLTVNSACRDIEELKEFKVLKCIVLSNHEILSSLLIVNESSKTCLRMKLGSGETTKRELTCHEPIRKYVLFKLWMSSAPFTSVSLSSLLVGNYACLLNEHFLKGELYPNINQDFLFALSNDLRKYFDSCSEDDMNNIDVDQLSITDPLLFMYLNERQEL